MSHLSEKLGLIYKVSAYKINTCLREVSKQLSIDENKVLFHVSATNMKKCLRDHNLIPLKIVGKGYGNEGLFQVCYKENCDYLLKFVEKEYIGSEIKYSEKFGKIGISPKVLIPRIDCKKLYGDSIGFVIKMVDGDLSELFLDPYFLNKESQVFNVFDQVIKIIKTVVIKYHVNHRDIKINNFVYKRTSKGIKVYLIDWGSAEEISSEYNEIILDSLRTFEMTFEKPVEYGLLTLQEV